MILVFLFLLLIFIILDSLFITLLLSNLEIRIDKLEISNIKEYIKNDYQIILSLYLFEKIKWFSINLNNKRIKRIYSRIDTSKINSKKIFENIKKINHNQFLKLKPNLKSFNLLAGLGIGNIIATSSIVFLFSLIISTVLPQLTREINENSFGYKVIPVYNKNVYYLKLDCIFVVKMVHIINIIYIYLIKRKEKDE